MRSKEYGNVVAAEIAKHLNKPELTLDAEKPKPAAFTAEAGLPYDPAGGWSKIEAVVILPPDVMPELARYKYKELACMLAERAAFDVLELLLLGDTTSDDTYLATMDGAVKLGACKGHVEFADEAMLEIKGTGKAGEAQITATLRIRVQWSAAASAVAA